MQEGPERRDYSCNTFCRAACSGMGEKSRRCVQGGFFQRLEFMEVEKTRKKVESQCICDEDGRLLRDKDGSHRRWARFFDSQLRWAPASPLSFHSKPPRPISPNRSCFLACYTTFFPSPFPGLLVSRLGRSALIDISSLLYE